MSNPTLTEAQFDAIDMKIGRMRRTQPEVSAAWEAAITLPQRTASEREIRREAIYATATRLGLI